MDNSAGPLRPTKFAEHKLVSAILDGTYPPGSKLPAERALAVEMGVTRPTLRETLKQMETEGWITIAHGKPTLVNDYLKTGGLGILSTLTRHKGYVPNAFVSHFLELRSALMPRMALFAVWEERDRLLAYLGEAQGLAETSAAYVAYDWGLHLILADLSGNPFYRMILNDFGEMYLYMGGMYFEEDAHRRESSAYYKTLREAVEASDCKGASEVVRQTMEQASALWKSMVGT
ncbi:GntR family transcriptional regulator [Desulfoluna spongiiphila]|uniref:GntR family transcriptional regulator, negative regulator for fad regulon and positive regulator of fabA n=1 Tax=Desulfoluna spongiiphila TaxID=419481 RepID=A0A1G5DM67_9BACT|nr:GntR family transcriptional regulator [Desulfoluna spongiiphila]SCY15839.1 GntR family transcriptional regulator, negative regulator for fad regulon and positive regulator of fabA [Desulfoluna spongiiphila]VVS95051.1 transcription regulator hth gntr [Desulfoluna spongiiphila]